MIKKYLIYHQGKKQEFLEKREYEELAFYLFCYVIFFFIWSMLACAGWFSLLPKEDFHPWGFLWCLGLPLSVYLWVIVDTLLPVLRYHHDIGNFLKGVGSLLLLGFLIFLLVTGPFLFVQGIDHLKELGGNEVTDILENTLTPLGLQILFLGGMIGWFARTAYKKGTLPIQGYNPDKKGE